MTRYLIRRLLQTVPVRDPQQLVILKWSGKNNMVTSLMGSSDHGGQSSSIHRRNVAKSRWPMGGTGGGGMGAELLPDIR